MMIFANPFLLLILDRWIVLQQGICYINSMKNDKFSEQRNLKKSIDRLQIIYKSQGAYPLLTALSYTGSLLNNYLQREENHLRARHYYELFQKEVRQYNQQIRKMEAVGQIQKRNIELILRQIKGVIEKYRHLKQGYEDNREEQQLKQAQNLYFSEKLKKIRHLYEEHNIDETWIEIQNLKQRASASQNIKQHMTTQIIKQLGEYEQQYQKMKQYYRNFEQTDGWVYDKEEDNVKLQYKIYEQQRTIAVRMNGQIDIEMLPFMAIVCQIDLQKHYIPFVKKSIQKKDNFNVKPPRNLKIGFNSTEVPLLANRQCYFYALGYDRMKATGSIFIYTKSFQDDLQFQQKYNYMVDHTDKIFLKVYYFCLEYIPISKNKAHVRIVTKSNFQLSFLPLFILTLTARNFTFDYYKNIVATAKGYKGSQWQQRVRQNPDMYNFFQSKIDEYFG